MADIGLLSNRRRDSIMSFPGELNAGRETLRVLYTLWRPSLRSERRGHAARSGRGQESPSVGHGRFTTRSWEERVQPINHLLVEGELDSPDSCL